MKVSLLKLNILVVGFLLMGLSSPRLCESAGPIPWVDINSDGTVSGWGEVVRGPYLFFYTDGGAINYKLVNGNFPIPFELYEGLYVEVFGTFQESSSVSDSGNIIVDALRFPDPEGPYHGAVTARKALFTINQD